MLCALFVSAPAFRIEGEKRGAAAFNICEAFFKEFWSLPRGFIKTHGNVVCVIVDFCIRCQRRFNYTERSKHLIAGN